MLSIIILTLDEERSLLEAIESCRGLGDVYVLDSGSRDRTCEIARVAGAEVVENPFESFGQQRNWAIEHLSGATPWQLHLDADERLTPELRAEIRRRLAQNPQVGGFFLSSKLMLNGRWLRRSSGYPVYQARLVHRERTRFVDHGHGQREESDWPLERLEHPYIHEAFINGLDEWIVKHNRYSALEVEEFFSSGMQLRVSDLFRGDRVRRRRALKLLANWLPARATLRFWATLLLQGGILDGRAGITFARMMAMYESMIALKVESRRTSDRRPRAN